MEYNKKNITVIKKMKNFPIIFSAVCVMSFCFSSEQTESRQLSELNTNTQKYRTCLAPYNGSYEYAENNIVALFHKKHEQISELITLNCINKDGAIDKDKLIQYEKKVYAILEKFWSGECCIVVDALYHKNQLKRDFNQFMDKVFEEDYVAKSKCDVNNLRYYVNMISAIIDISRNLLK